MTLIKNILKKYFFLILFLCFITFGIGLRLYYAGSFNSYKTNEGKYISSNPDGLYWLSSGKEDPNELWAKYNPLNNKYFSLICFVFVVFIGLFILNFRHFDLKSSSLYVFFMFFSKFLYIRSSVGYYDHDYLGVFIFMVLVLYYYVGRPFIILSPLIVYILSFVWDGIVPVAYLFILIYFLEYISKEWKIKGVIFKYFVYVGFVLVILKTTFSPYLYITETIFHVPYIIIMLPFLIVGFILAEKHDCWFWKAILVFSSIIILHSARTVILAYPLIFLTFCVLLKQVTKKKSLTILLIIVFLVTQFGNYTQLPRFGTSLTDEGLYYLRENTPKNTSILSWWDYGYYIEYLSHKSAVFAGNAAAKGLDELSLFYCDGTLPKTYDFDYFIHFPYQNELIVPIINFKNLKCSKVVPYIYEIDEDPRFKLVYLNKDIEIYRKKGDGL